MVVFLRYILLFLFVLNLNVVFSQQDAMFTKYMFNTLVYNPAYAGSFDYLSVNVLHRSQWLGIEGAPTTQTLSIHSPVNDRVGLGFSLVNDAIGVTGTTSANFIYAYRFKVGKGTLSTSLQAGVVNWRADFNKLSYKDGSSGDLAFMDMTPSKWLPNFGAGIYYQTSKAFLGFSSPHIVNHDLRDKDAAEDDENLAAQLYRHYYGFGGIAIPLSGQDLVFRPTFLVKRIGMFGEKKRINGRIAAPTEIDLDMGFFFYQKLWLGASYRTAFEALTNQSSSVDSGDIWAAFHFTNGLRLGAAYDYTLSRLRTTAGGSFEIMLGYELDYQINRIVTPRYF
jgi:type IX secretion system PorP/SprF family membrane protein